MYKITEFTDWPFSIVIEDEIGILTRIDRAAWSTRDDLRACQSRPENIVQMERIKRLVDLANRA
jgi:hypothetical protein